MRHPNGRTDTQTTTTSSIPGRGKRGGRSSGGGYVSTKSDSQTPTQRLNTGQGGGGVDQDQLDAVEESLPSSKIILPYMFLHPKVVPRLLFQSIAGIYWVQVRTQLRFFPLRFIQKPVEQDYRKILNKTFRIRIPIGMAILSLSSLLSWVLLGLAKTHRWVEIEGPEQVWQVFHATSALATLSTLFCIITPSLKWTEKHLELCFYACGGISNTAWLAWACWAIVKAKPDLTKVTSMADLEETIRHYFEFKMVCDALTAGILIATLVNTDIFLHTLSSRSIYFHLYTWALFITSRLSQNPSLADIDTESAMTVPNAVDAGTCFILYLVGWSCRWFRELQDRAVVIRVRESQAKLARVRDSQKTRRRRRDQSAAEEIIELLNQCKSTVGETKGVWQKTSKTASTQTLDEAENLLLECVKTLAAGADSMMQVRRVAASETRDDEELEEDAFIEMYRANRVMIQKADDPSAQRKARGGTRTRSQGTADGITKKVTIKGQEQIQYKMNYFGLDFPGLHLLDVFQTSVGRDYGLRLLDYKTRTPIILVEVGFVLLQPLLNYLECDEPCLLAALYCLERFYFPGNPYHTSCHAANVAHCAVSILSMTDILNYALELEKIAFIMAALGHDIAHPGRTNNFFINTNSILAISQNDAAVLESAHSIITQNVLTACPETNIFGSLSKVEYMAIRKLLITMILSTDMSKHFELLSKARVRRVSPEFDSRTNEQDRQMVMGLAFKAADLGHATLDWSQHLDWSLRISEEYYQQGEDEKSLGIPMSPLCDRAEHHNYARTQAGFLQFVVAVSLRFHLMMINVTFFNQQPLVEELMELDDTGMIG